MKEFVTIPTEEVTIERVIEKSRFIAFAKHVESVDEAMEFINSKRKKYFDATHNCYAYIVGDKAKFYDDGEPQGTAGLPMYECIKNNNLDYICVVVTRYFGGIKLGAGGLVRAYSGSVSDVIKSVTKVKMRNCTRADVTVEYSLLKTLRKALQGYVKEENVVYDTRVTLQCLFLSDLSTTILDIISQNTLGKGVLEIKEQILAPYEQ